MEEISKTSAATAAAAAQMLETASSASRQGHAQALEQSSRELNDISDKAQRFVESGATA